MNIINFLNDNNIYFTDTGNNVKQGNVNIKCCFCSNDPSEHLGISLKSPHVWGCWRNADHRGKDIVDLIIKLIGCSYSEAKAIVEQDKSLLEESSMLSKINSIFNKEEVIEKIKGVESLEFPNSFKKISSFGVYKKFYDYMVSRNFKHFEIIELVDHYNLQGCLIGDYAYRVIIPIYYKKKLVSWTGRIIGGNESLRYLDLSPNKSVIALKSTLLDFDNFHDKGGDKLFVTEGAFDCINLFRFGLNVTCTFTVNLSISQKYLLSQLSKKFNEIIILPDRNFEIQAWQLKKDLAYLKNISVQVLPQGVDDPGELNKYEIDEYFT